MPTLILTLFLSLGATDPGTTFHEAYLMEVVEGKVADAAKLYFEVMEDADAPAALRLRARFRFGVTCVLLGRADEARAKFAEVLADPAVPAALKARVEEYAAAVREVEVGTQLDRKLEEMVFELGRANLAMEDNGLEPTAKVYRDFAIVGKPAVPLLRKLLGHPDALLRQHAFRLLCRMGEEGMVARYDPKVHTSASLTRDFGGYVRSRPEELPALLEKLLALDDEILGRTVGRFRLSYSMSPLPIEFLREMARRGQAEEASRWALGDAAVTLFTEWLASEDDDLRHLATSRLLSWKPEQTKGLVTPERFPRMVKDLLAAGKRIDYEGVERHIVTMPPSALLDALEVSIRNKWFANRFIGALNSSDSAEVDLPRYAELLKGAMQPVLQEDRFHFLLHHLPLEEAKALAAWLAGRDEAPVLIRGFTPDRPRDVEVMMAVWRASPLKRARAVSLPIWWRDMDKLPPEVLAAQAEFLPELVETIAADELHYLDTQIPVLLSRVEPELAGRVLVEVMGTRTDRKSLHSVIAQPQPDYLETWHLKVVIPALEVLWKMAEPSFRLTLITYATNILRQDLGPARSQVLDFLRSHLGDFDDRNLWQNLIRTGALPYEELVPPSPPEVWSGWGAFPEEKVNPAAEKLLADLTEVNESVVGFLLPQKDAGIWLDRILEEAPLPAAEMVVWRVNKYNGLPASPEALEKAYLRLVEDEETDLPLLNRLGTILSRERPSEALFPLARRLLAEEDRALLESGMIMAGRLGREELIPDLVKRLASMDQVVRDRAKQAIDSILAVKRIQEEARQLSEEK